MRSIAGYSKKRLLHVCAKALVGCFAANTVLYAADIQRGAQVARDANCLECHRVAGVGGRLANETDAADLDSSILTRYTAPALASSLWNHTPLMRGMARIQSLPHPKITETESEDLFAYICSLRLSDRAGDAKAGERVFDKKGCAECHAAVPVSGGVAASAPSVTQWNVSSDPFVLARAMWNHAPAMKRAMERRARIWPKLSGQDLLDINQFVRASKTSAAKAIAPAWPDARQGKALFDASCKQCHSGSMALERMLVNRTLMDIPAGMWNHSARMMAIPVVSNEEMGSIVAYAWQLQYLGSPGNAARGAETFTKKRCVECHGESGNLNFQRGARIFTPFALVSLAWEHGTLMEQEMKRKKIRWPSLSAEDISDVVAFVNSRP